MILITTVLLTVTVSNLLLALGVRGLQKRIGKLEEAYQKKNG